MRRALSGIGAFAPLCLLLAVTAHADVTPDQAQALQRQLRDGVAAALGPSIDATTLNVSPDGDHYRLEVPLPGPIGNTGAKLSGAPLTAALRPLEGGRWQIDDARLPSPLQLTLPGDRPGGFTVEIGEQDVHGVIDPTMASLWTLDGRFRALHQTVQTRQGQQVSSIERMVWHQTLQPSHDGKADLRGEATLEGYANHSPLPDGGALELAIDRIHAVTDAGQVDFAAIGRALRASLDLAAMAKTMKGADHPKMTPAQRDTLQTLLESLGVMAAAMDGEETMEGVHFDAGAHGAKLAQVTIRSGFGAPQGRADLHLRLALDGIESPDIPPGPFRDFLPRHIVLAPRIGGVPKPELMRTLSQAIDAAAEQAGGPEPAAVIGELLASGPLTLGIDELLLDLGPAKLTGHGTLDIASLADMTGGAELRLTGMDALLRLASSTPEAKQALPVLILLKGIGREDGGTTVWKISYADGKAAVNGTDLSALIPGTPPKKGR